MWVNALNLTYQRHPLQRLLHRFKTYWSLSRLSHWLSLKLDKGRGGFEDIGLLVMTAGFTKNANASPCPNQLALTADT